MFLSYFLRFSLLSTVICELNIHLQQGENNTVILTYNLTSNYSYLITFRSFGHEQFQFGPFPPTEQLEEHSIEIFPSYSPTDLLIICFHFLRQIYDLDIQCHDRSLRSNEENQSDSDILPSYHPYFVPMMYALSIVMILPVIIQHHQQKKTQVLQRRKELRRLSVSISQDKQNPQRKIVQKVLSQIDENGNLDYENLPLDLNLISAASTKTILDDLDDNPSMNFTLQNLQPFIAKDALRKASTTINAHDCIAHLLDHTPWNTPSIDQPLSTSLGRHPVVRDCPTAIKEQHVPIIITLDDDDDRIPMINTKKFSKENPYRTNQAFLESDV